MRICLVAVLGVLVLVAGCTSSPDRKPTPKPSASATTVTPIAPAKATALKVGTDLPVVEDLPEKIGKENANFIGFASSNVLFGQLSVPDKGSKGSVTTQSHPMLYNRNSRSATLLDDGLVRAAKTKVLDMVSVEANTVWVESSKVNPADGDISVYSYDRTSRFRRLMTGTPVHDPKLVYADDLAVVGTRVYFSMASIDHKSGEGSAIYSAAASGGGHVKVLVPDGQRITVDGTKMTYSVGKKKFVRDFDSGDTTPAPISSHAGDASFCGAVFRTAYKAVCDGDSVGQSGVVGHQRVGARHEDRTIPRLGTSRGWRGRTVARLLLERLGRLLAGVSPQPRVPQAQCVAEGCVARPGRRSESGVVGHP
jgi:hypothetical protein